MATSVLRINTLRAGNFPLRSVVTHVPRATLVSKTQPTTADLFTEAPRQSLQLKFRPRLAGRKYLPGSAGSGFPEFLASPTDSFPYAVHATKPSLLTLQDWARECREFIDGQLFNKEVILLRDLPLSSAADFAAFSVALGYKKMNYIGGSGNRSKTDATAGTYTASDDPPEFSIEPHNELSYAPKFPHKLFFFCLSPPKEGCGGETPLVQNRKLMARLDPEVIRNLEKRKLMYMRYSPNKGNGGYITWQDCFGTEDRKEAEGYLEELGYDYSWDRSGGLSYWYVRPAFTKHPISGEKIFFNQLTAHNSSFYKASPVMAASQDAPDNMCPGHTRYGDGSEIEPAVLQHIRAVSWSCAVGFQWQQGDLLVFDNLLAQHARLGFTGERKLLLSMTEN